jgi:hypothetical protein
VGPGIASGAAQPAENVSRSSNMVEIPYEAKETVGS